MSRKAGQEKLKRHDKEFSAYLSNNLDTIAIFRLSFKGVLNEENRSLKG